ncbi:DUF1643 domain-containing protein [Poriferisphaera sp. WC338]|uniref:DUF1643 domain-containing protein n=1 Tax=Poriferisphaera sp. WC338 TaxID=3425129 RepID=UPI003D815423
MTQTIATPIPTLIQSTARFSDCRQYRYTLHRIWDTSKPYCMFVGLNPSTADEIQNDPTVRRCIGYAIDWNFGGLIMTNIFSFRATDPKDMKAHPEPVGPKNNYWLKKVSADAGLTLCAWGNHGSHLDRATQVIPLLTNPHCLKVTGAGHPSHPLYLKKDLQPIPFSV